MMHSVLANQILSAVGRGHHHLESANEAQDTDSSLSQVTAANKEFACHLYRKLAAHADFQSKNIFFSPVSVSTALASLSVGARGETHRQLFSGLGFNSSQLTQTDVDQSFCTLLQNAKSDNTSEGTAVFVDNHFKLQPEFLEVLKQSYFAEGFNVDFTQTTESADTINKYVETKTNGKIDKLVESLDENTVMYLISYIYFKGRWETPFCPQMTREDHFHAPNAKVPVQMMYMEEDVDVYYDQAINTSVLRLPFKGTHSMLLMLPDDMARMENAISPGHVTEWLKLMESRRYKIYVPKFSIKTSYILNNVLTEMGMADMFGDRANLTGISEDHQLFVSKVVHQATLDVNEAGATAAAATGIELMFGSSRFRPVIPVLKFDRPFMVMITERNTENILFMGKIINPNI
ncbi:hibernation-specific plasma protein HP-55-like [Archocentrus centrarchus]|uniref:hibernation-specific plasma protein HP-55-like n=1 Tax=Archocentrus centrarchus TaxID=63155 RepID=UPI0011EA5176|nr:hibernation-specific plasma protein HP-55-like [Archocentrus centrarchus]